VGVKVPLEKAERGLEGSSALLVDIVGAVIRRAGMEGEGGRQESRGRRGGEGGWGGQPASPSKITLHPRPPPGHRPQHRLSHPPPPLPPALSYKEEELESPAHSPKAQYVQSGEAPQAASQSPSVVVGDSSVAAGRGDELREGIRERRRK
jgi:hypothetical protein